MTSKVTYLGELRTSSIHMQSGSEIITDAPTDNHGRGEAFSPTDMVANSLATCMLSFMGIKANELDVDLKGSTADVTKTMQAEPRKIAKIQVVFNMKSDADEKSRIILERVARSCAVGLSLSPDVVQDIHSTGKKT